MLLMPASCHPDRCCYRLYHNTKAINFTITYFTFYPIYCRRHNLVH